MKLHLLLAAPVALSACVASSAMTDPLSSSPMPVSAGKTLNYAALDKRAGEAAALVRAQNEFGARLVEKLESNNSKHENLIASPTSLWQALAMTRGGARGATKTQMGSLLAMGALPDDKIAAQNRAFNTLLKEQKGASISVANSLWFADSFRANPTFVRDSKAGFGAGVESFAAANPALAASRINAWVGAHTQKEITQIVTPGDIEGQSSLLVNAVYFKGGWQTVFNTAETKPAPFHLANGKVVPLPTMHAEISQAFLSGQTFEGARLPYKNTSCALWILLPTAGKKPADVLRELGQEKSRQLRPTVPVVLSLPRFEVEWRRNVVGDLAKTAPLPFSTKADFGAMGAPVMNISLVLHVCKMRVDEEGTVAAAATVVGMARSARPAPQTPKILKFDRPFVVALVEETSGARLFEGTVYNPGAKS